MTARQIEQALLQAAPQERAVLAVRLLAIALADDEVLNPVPAGCEREGTTPAGGSGTQR